MRLWRIYNPAKPNILDEKQYFVKEDNSVVSVALARHHQNKSSCIVHILEYLIFLDINN